MNRGYSIRKQLLKWLLLPMLLLLLLDSSVLYHYANKLMQDSLDSELVSTADEIGEFLEINSNNKINGLGEDAKQDLLKSSTDNIYYNVLDSAGNVLAGEPNIKPSNSRFMQNHPKFYYAVLGQQKLRAVLVPTSLVVAGEKRDLYIQVAETLNKRTQLREKILAWILVPQVILIVTASLLLWVGIKKSLSPLLMIDDELAQRNAQDLKPMQLDGVPLEVSKLVVSLNGLMFKLNQAMLAQNRFIADAAHQLRTPLAGTLAQIELADKSRNMPEIKDRLGKISLSTERLIHLVNQLLVLAKNQPEAVNQVNLIEIELASFVKNVILDFEAHAANKQIDLSYFGLNESIIITGDNARLYNLIFNLIDNAIRYTPETGQVKVGLAIESGQAALIVQDNGVGISQSEQEKVFERFYRSQDALAFGTGLGLAIVKEIASMHNATIQMQSCTAAEAKVNQMLGTKITGTKITVLFASYRLRSA